MKTSFRIGFLLSLAFAGTVRAEDWPQWQGAKRDGVIREKGLLAVPPKAELDVAWRFPVGGGYSGPAVADGKVFVTDYQLESGDTSNDPGTRRELKGEERIICIDEKTGKQIWLHAYSRPYNISYPSGPRATPTVDGKTVYTLGAEGDLIALNVADGKVVWQKNLPETYKAQTPLWGYSSHVLIHGDLLFTLAGGEGSAVVALDKSTGEEKWRALSASEIGYAPPTLLDRNGQIELLVWTADELNSLDPTTGKVHWNVPLKPSYGMSIMAPQVEGNLLFASGIGGVSAMFELAKDFSAPKLLWSGKPKDSVYCANSTPMFVNGVLYGSDCQTGSFYAVDAKNAARLWESYKPTTGQGGRRASHGTAFLARYGDIFYVWSETGDLIWAKLTREKYEELGRTHLIDPTGECFGRQVVWSYPAYANQHIFVRNDKELISVSLKAK